VDYIKVCSPDPKELNEWAVGNLGYGLRSLRCQHCNPSSLGLTE
jgi:phage FluMu protein Com